MNRVDSNTLDYFDRTLTRLIMERQKLPEKVALRKFLFSETYRMLSAPALKLWRLSPLAILDLWEAEQKTGDPRNSLYTGSM